MLAYIKCCYALRDFSHIGYSNINRLMEPNFCSFATDSFGPTMATRHLKLLVLLAPALSVCSLCHGLFRCTCCLVAWESATILALLALFVRFYSIAWVILCWVMSVGALVLLVHLHLHLLSSLWVNSSVRITLSVQLYTYVSSSGSMVVHFFAVLSVRFWFWQPPVLWFCIISC